MKHRKYKLVLSESAHYLNNLALISATHQLMAPDLDAYIIQINEKTGEERPGRRLYIEGKTGKIWENALALDDFLIKGRKCIFDPTGETENVG